MSDTVTIYGSHFSGSRVLANGVHFNGTPTTVLGISESVLVVRVPFGATSGPIAVCTMTDSVIGPVFTVDSLCDQNLCIAPYYGQLLTEQQSWQRDMFYRYVRWSGRVLSDSVVLSLEYQVGNETIITQLLRFTHDRTTNTIPASVDGFLIYHIRSTTETDTLRGLVSIQSWDTAGVVSGKVSWFYETYSWWRDFVFWYDFSPHSAK